MTNTKQVPLSARIIDELERYEQAVREDIVNHINGNKTRDSYITKIEGQRRFEALVKTEVNKELKKVSNILTGSEDFRVEPAIRLYLTIGQIRAIRLAIEQVRKEWSNGE